MMPPPKKQKPFKFSRDNHRTEKATEAEAHKINCSEKKRSKDSVNMACVETTGTRWFKL